MEKVDCNILRQDRSLDETFDRGINLTQKSLFQYWLNTNKHSHGENPSKAIKRTLSA